VPRGDAAYYYAYLPSVVLDRDLELDDEYEVTGNWYGLGRTPVGRAANVFGIGPALFELPGFLVGHAVARLTSASREGFSAYETTAALWMGIPFTVGAILLAIRIARRRVSRSAAIVGALAAAFAGPVIYYAVRQPGYAHPFATFCAVLLVERWDASYGSGARSLRTWLGLGLAFGLCVLARPQLALWGFLLGAAAVDDLRQPQAPWHHQVSRWASGGVLALLLISIQLVVWKRLYGSWYVVPQGPGFMRWDASCWSETLFSSRNGLFPWAPFYLFALLGLPMIAPRRGLPGCLRVGLAAQAFVNGAAWDWWAGGSFGGRRFDSTYVVFSTGAAGLFELLGRGLRAARTRPVTFRARAIAVGAAITGVLCGLMIIAQVRLTLRTSVTSARMSGGVAAAQMWRRRVGGLDGAVAAVSSSIANLPVRVAFAWRHDLDLGSYDRLVGAHLLGETYPGLSREGDKVREVIRVNEFAHHDALGLERGDAGFVGFVEGRARIPVGLNRTGGLELSLVARSRGRVQLRWNGRLLLAQRIDGPTRLTVCASDLKRGLNWLEIAGPVGTAGGSIELVAKPIGCP